MSAPSDHSQIVNDELNFIDIATRLWHGRRLIATSITATMAIATIYAASAPQTWTSVATISPASFEQMGPYYLIKTKLDANPLFASKSPEVSVNLQNSANPQETVKQPEIKIAAALFNSVQTTLDVTDGVSLIRPDGRKQTQYQVLASADSAQNAQKFLNTVLNTVNHQIAEAEKRKLKAQLDILQTALRIEQNEIRLSSQASRKRELQTTQQSLETAKRAGIVNFSGASYAGLDTPSMQFLLGTKLLDARLVTLTQAPLELPQRYFDITTMLDSLKALPVINASEFSSFKQVSPPSLPVAQEKPTRTSIIGMGGVIGLLLGCLLAIGRETWVRLRTALCEIKISI